MQWFWDNVYLSRDERGRFIFALYILAFFSLVNIAMARLYEPAPPEVDSTTLESINMVSIHKKKYAKDSLSRINDSSVSTKKAKNKSSKKSSQKVSVKQNFQTFSFNPNTLSKDSLLMLGLSRYSVNSLLKYREKGGKIWKADQMSKINGIDQATLDRLLPFVKLPNKKKYAKKDQSENGNSTFTKSKASQKQYKKKTPRIIEINTADTSDFMNLYGIGTTYSNRIVRYRNYLGGFIGIDQISNVWGISDSLYQTLVPYLTVDPTKVVKKNINTMSKDELEKHPYINWKKSKHILAYKKAHGDYSHMDDLYKLHGLQEEFVDTLKMYFDVK